MITAEAKGQWKRKIEALRDDVRRSGATETTIEPTSVLEQLSRIKGSSVLEMIPRDAVARLKREFAPKIKAAIIKPGRSWSGRGRRIFHEWAMRFVAELAAAARRGAWGAVEEATRQRKRRDRSRYSHYFGVRSAQGWERDLEKNIDVKDGR